ncbi:hypothetical protein [Kitasatospora sp. NPDC056181]|uniref:hypothetical protein n=1 Tax=Kitasatospora sp. NPDC056181 TaxID=3345737 RepID=UPI0035DD84E7
MNAERFEERLMHELKNHVQQRAQSPHPESPVATRPRKRLGVRLALPAGLAAAVAGVTMVVLPAQTAAAYTLEHADGDLVKLTIVNPAGKVNLDQLHKDLDRLGVPNVILLGDPHCSTPPGPSTAPGQAPFSTATPSSPTELRASKLASQGWDIGEENGKTVLYVRPDKIPAHSQLMVGFPLAKTDPTHRYGVIESALITGHTPTCLPAAWPWPHDPSRG